tara:strand:+ start:426 stop:1304 length:879 start_codon:yes stop_codon:yes gene_type:complete
MEMIDVLQKLKEIAETKPELVKDAVDNVQRTNPTEAMNPKQQAAIAIAKKEKMKEGGMKDYLHDEAEKLSREEFLKKHGESLRGFYDAINGSEDDEDSIAGEGKMMKKEQVKEDMHITTDSPQEASMLMQILKMAGLQPVDAKMMGMEPEHDMEPKPDMDHDDAMGTMQMAKMRNMMTAPEEEKAAETFANEPEEKVQDVDSLVNKQSGGLNRQKSSFTRAEPGDNPMTAEDKITEEDLANSLRSQYESFKETYQKAAETKAKPDFLDMDKDGNKTEPMKKAVKDKEEKEAK